jgi:hypothetical protein
MSPPDHENVAHDAVGTAADASEPDWAMADAVAQASDLTRDFPASTHAHADSGADAPTPDPLPMWNDDEFLDIMPSPEAARASTETPHWTRALRDNAGKDAPPRDESLSALFGTSEPDSSGGAYDDIDAGAHDAAPDERADATNAHAGSPFATSEMAARALEGLAARVRSGDLQVPGYAPELGDAAALAAALAALLGVRG